MKKQESLQTWIPLINSGHSHETLRRTDRITVFLPSENHHRAEAVAEGLEVIGLPVTVKQIAGPAPEIGVTTRDRAVHKVLSTADELVAHGYFSRHPADLTVILAADSRNKRAGKYRDKPRNENDFMNHGEEWTQTFVDGEPLIHSEAAYAAMTITGTYARIVTVTDQLLLCPLSRHVIEGIFQPTRFDDQRSFAHSLGAEMQITEGNLAVISLQGEHILGAKAIHRVSGASTERFTNLLLHSLEGVL